MELIDAKGDLEGALRREQPRVTVLGEKEATPERMARVRTLAPKTALHVQEGWAAARPP